MQKTREEELVGVPQRQLGAKVDKEQEQESLAGVLLPHWVGGKDAALDVTVVIDHWSTPARQPLWWVQPPLLDMPSTTPSTGK